jgi:3-oxoacyl-(acyl-carrier-protein) synthase
MAMTPIAAPVITGKRALVGRSCGVDALWSLMQAEEAQFSWQEGFAPEPVLLGKVTVDIAPMLSTEVLARAARCVHLGLISAHQALQQAALPDTPKAMHEGMRAIHPFTVPKVMPSALGGWFVQQTGITGPNLCLSTACSSSANALAEGAGFMVLESQDSAQRNAPAVADTDSASLTSGAAS